MIKDNEEFLEKMNNFIKYTEKMKSSKNITKGHKQRFINMVIELLKIKRKNSEIKKWINYILSYYQKEINIYKKCVEEPVVKKLEQLFYEFFFINENKQNEKHHLNNSTLSQKELIHPNNNSGNKAKKNNNDKKDLNRSLSKDNYNYGGKFNISSKLNKIKNDKKEDILNKTDLAINLGAESKLLKKINQLIEKINSYDSIKNYLINLIDKENKTNKIFCEIYSLIINNLSLESDNIKEKMLIIISCIFPFISNKQKQQIISSEKQFSGKMRYFLKDTNLFYKPKNNYLSEYLIQSIINKESNSELISKIFHKNLFIYTIEELFELYQLYLISKIFNFYNVKVFLYQISFKLKFILKNYNELYASHLGYNFEYVFKTLNLFKKFYTNVYHNKLIIDEKINYIKIYFDEKKNNCELIRNCNTNLDILLSNEDNKIYDKLIANINMFYTIKNSINLISGYSKELKNYEFPFNIIELINFKNELIAKNFQKYKLNLINIEKYIYYLGCESLFPNRNIIKRNNISFYSINSHLKNVVTYLDIFLHKKLHFNFKLYPYGSATEFLSDKESDIDLFLDISEIEENENKIKFLCVLFKIIRNIDKHANLTISTRVCVITFEFNSVSFDISIVGFCPYLHSALIREYSLIDPRFPLLVIAIKHIIKILKIKNIVDDKSRSFLNSFSWVLLLIGFLQDIVKPSVLPKILENSEIFEKRVLFGNNKIEKDEDDDKNYENKYEKISKTKNFESFINNMEIETIQIPKNLGNKVVRFKNYKKQIKEKNNMSCSELLLKFLEFVIFYFKYDTIFINNSFAKEGFQNMENINDETIKENISFINYFNQKYIKKNKGERNRDGHFLIRDPFDPRYNPGQTLKLNSLKKFFSRLKMAYFNLIKYGNLNLVKKHIEFEENYKSDIRTKNK